MAEPLLHHPRVRRDSTAEMPPHEWLGRLVRCAILAPSSHNTQPWRFAMAEDTIELWADRSRRLSICDPAGRELVMSCGAALFNLRVACHRFGRESPITLLPDPDDPDLLARAACGSERPVSLEDRRLFEAIFRRRTHRAPFERHGVGDPVLQRLVEAVEREGAWLVPIEGPRRAAVGELIEEATRAQFRDRRFRLELASWLRSSARRVDGIPGHALGYGAVVSRVVPWVLRGIDVGGRQAASDRQLAERSPVLAVLGTDRESAIHWLRSGMALERALLSATAEGLSASFLNSPIQVDAYRQPFADLLGAPGSPQLLLRIGYGRAPSKKPTPRRPLADVMKAIA